MEIRNSKLYYLSFASFGPIIFIIILLSPNDKQNSIENPILFFSIFGLLIGIFTSFLLYKALDKKPIIIITKDEIYIRKKKISYQIKDLAFYKIENLGSRYSRFNFIHFYDQNKSRKFHLAMVGWDKNIEDVKKQLKNKIKEIK